jgi:opacity protein-like surface antigen
MKAMRPFHRSQLALACVSALLAQSAFAEDFIKGGDDKFTFNLGGIVNQFGTSFALNGAAQQGSTIDLEGNGLAKSLTSIEASGTWRWTENNRSDFLYFSAKRGGSRTVDKDIVIGDQVIPVGFTADAQAKDEFLWLDYRYSFVKNDKLEFAGVLGLYGGNFKFDINATGSDGEGGTRTINSSSSTTVPLPLIGASLDWYIEPRWKVNTMLVGMGAKIGNVDGNAYVFQLGTDYMITRNWGLGLSYMYSRVNVDVSKSGFNGKIDWSTNAVLAYATLKF